MRGADCGFGERGLILIAHDDAQRAPYARRVATWSVVPKRKSRARGDRLLPLGVAVVRVQRTLGVDTVRSGEHGDGVRLPDQRDQQWLATDETAEGIEDGHHRVSRRDPEHAAPGGRQTMTTQPPFASWVLPSRTRRSG